MDACPGGAGVAAGADGAADTAGAVTAVCSLPLRGRDMGKRGHVQGLLSAEENYACTCACKQKFLSLYTSLANRNF